VRLDQRVPVAAAPAREPGERAFGFVDGDAGAAVLDLDLSFAQRQVPGTKGIDARFGPIRQPGRGT
jgi:hypothetical protein